MVYISRPADRGPWRVKCDDRPVEEIPDREAAIAHAVAFATVVEASGRDVTVKIERPDGSWVVYGGRGPWT